MWHIFTHLSNCPENVFTLFGSVSSLRVYQRGGHILYSSECWIAKNQNMQNVRFGLCQCCFKAKKHVPWAKSDNLRWLFLSLVFKIQLHNKCLGCFWRCQTGYNRVIIWNVVTKNRKRCTHPLTTYENLINLATSKTQSCDGVGCVPARKAKCISKIFGLITGNALK